MGEQTGISWCHHTFNPWIGCAKVSPACDGCYAEALMGEAGRYKRVTWGQPGAGAGTRSRTAASTWRQPLKWDRAAKAAGERRFVFCASLADVFDNQVHWSWRQDLFGLIHATPNLTWLLLTKRPSMIVTLFHEAYVAEGWPANAAIGTTIEDRLRLRQNAPALAEAAKALDPAFTFWSCEPLLESLGNLGDVPAPGWIITGGETDQGGHKARPTHPDWLRSIRDQALAAGIPYHHKQNGEWLAGHQFISEFADLGGDGQEGVSVESDVFDALYRVGKKASGRLLDGELHDAMPGAEPLR
jgi:protein gp37